MMMMIIIIIIIIIIVFLIIIIIWERDVLFGPMVGGVCVCVCVCVCATHMLLGITVVGYARSSREVTCDGDTHHSMGTSQMDELHQTRLN